jgi:hypothetical protein
MSGITLSLREIKPGDRLRVGGKGFALAVMAEAGLVVPPALCITHEAYLEFVTTTGMRETILLELGRKSFEDMRWEEIWDTALRIRNLFARLLCRASFGKNQRPPRPPVFGPACLRQVLSPWRRRRKNILRRSSRILCQCARRRIYSGAHQACLGLPVVRQGPSLQARVGP